MLSRFLLRPSSSIICQLNSTSMSSVQHPVAVLGISISRPFMTSNQLKGIDDGPERDHVNYPRPKRLMRSPPVRFGVIPDNWFRFMYHKTGVTGPYVFGFGLVTYLFSKEIWVMEHEFWGGVSFFAMIIYAVKKFGPVLNKYTEKGLADELKALNSGRDGDIQRNKNMMEEEKTAQWRASEGSKILFDVKRESVALQQEAVYRERLMHVYSEVKKRLDYQVEKQQVERNIQQKHMVNWITNRVLKAITPESEQENLKKCIADLKGLAVKF